MATLTPAELQSVRNAAAATLTFDYPKPVINAAAQAVETLLTNSAVAISNAIDIATSPTVLSAAQKKKIAAETLRLKYLRDS